MSSVRGAGGSEYWPALPYAEWADTYLTLHLWTQIVGKVRLASMPWINHSWHVPLYLSARGLTTSAMPYRDRSFEIEFDFVDHRLDVRTSEGDQRRIELRPRSVADFHDELFRHLDALGLEVAIHGSPNELADSIPFARDRVHASYDPEYANRHWRVLIHSERVLQAFRAGFIGKCSPVHFFWGSFDFAVTRFSGRPAPPHPGGIPNLPDWIVQEAYSHEVSSAGFWPGGGASEFPLFYSYAYPEPEGYASAKVRPGEAFYSESLREFVLPYDAVRTSPDPDATLLAFLQSTYEAAAEFGAWDRSALERPEDPREAERSRRP